MRREAGAQCPDAPGAHPVFPLSSQQLRCPGSKSHVTGPPSASFSHLGSRQDTGSSSLALAGCLKNSTREPHAVCSVFIVLAVTLGSSSPTLSSSVHYPAPGRALGYPRRDPLSLPTAEKTVAFFLKVLGSLATGPCSRWPVVMHTLLGLWQKPLPAPGMCPQG